MSATPSLDRLTACLARLPGIGSRSAERMALRLARDSQTLLRDLISALEDVAERVCFCSRCGAVTQAGANPCLLCSSPTRDGTMLCVVEDPNDILLIERSGAFEGRYHALMGKISPMKGDGPANLRMDSLRERVRKEGIREVVLALNTDVEGDATASFIEDMLRPGGVKVSRLAFGLPVGSGIMYSDPVTLGRAMRGRTFRRTE